MTRRLAYVGFAAVLGAGCDRTASPPPAVEPASHQASARPLIEFTSEEIEQVLSLSPLADPPRDPTNAVAEDPRAARLGQFLFFDPRLSLDGTISCAECHDPETGFADGKSLGSALGELTRHTPGLANVAYNRWFFWDGRADTLWAQALGPIENELEHGASRLQCAHVIHRDPDVRAAYETIFGPMPDLSDTTRFPEDARPVPGDPEHPHALAWASMTTEDQMAANRVFANLGKSIAAYERRLLSRRAPFDVFVEGLQESDGARLAALDESAQRGLKLFIGRANCTLCHFGPNFTDGEFHSTGVPPLRGTELKDAGRYEGITRLREDVFNGSGPYTDATGDDARRAADKVDSLLDSTESWGQFKTPSLREVGGTPPYMHQGQFDTLERVVRHYNTLEDAVLPGHHQEQLLVPLELSEAEQQDLVAFLRSLSGDPLSEELRRPPNKP